MAMNKTVIDILCRRDGINEAEAKARILCALTRMDEECFDPEACEDIMMEELGLEMDYLELLLH